MPKMVTVSRDPAGRYFVSMTIEEPAAWLPATNGPSVMAARLRQHTLHQSSTRTVRANQIIATESHSASCCVRSTTR